jgi:hypothetical protein
VGDVRLRTPSGALWVVTGTNGENVVSAKGITQAVAWANALLQAEAVGMAGRFVRKEQRT